NSILVNGKRVNIPSYQVRPGDVVEVAEKSKQQLRIKGAIEAAEQRGFPEWLEVDVKALKGTYKARPQRDELPSTINESLVVELYSK
ncbi:MAG TPA: S4 domain-containing protein, partial [Novimethylophilus sp.]|uniref:30S ribosomal protein S4 n=1 Tax=Novimethylophilus sp. TaxID=2137426 RepID=UPI002F3F97A7